MPPVRMGYRCAMNFRITPLLLCAPLLALTACATPTAPASPPSPAPAPAMPPPALGGECNAANAQFAVGRSVDAALQDDARQRSGARTVRVIRPGDAVTMDYSTQRLNLELDAAGKVARARCG